MIQVFIAIAASREPIDFCFGQAKDFTELPHRCAVLKRIVNRNQCRVLKTLENKIGHIVAVGPRKIQIKIWRIGTVQVDKALKIQIQIDGVHIGNAQQVGNQAIGTTTAPHIKITFAAGVAQDFPVDQEIGHKAFLIDDFSLFFKAIEDLLLGLLPKTVAQALFDQYIEQF